jgi:Fe-S oxidoreductase
MNSTPSAISLMEEKVSQLTEKDLEKALEVFRQSLEHEATAYLNSCVHCGLCDESCHYFLTYRDLESMPAYKLRLVTDVFKGHFSRMGRTLPRLIGAKKLNHAMIRAWLDSLFGRCSLCGRCSINCTIGINITQLIRAARGALAVIGLVPPGLQSTVDTALLKGNNMGIAPEDWLETVEWLEEELQAEVEDPAARLPLDEQNVNLFYTINPREAMFFPLSIVAAAKIFYAAGESWTFSKDNYDVTNYGLYNGDDTVAGALSNRLVESTMKLNARTLVLAECGHGFNSNRWEAPEWLSKKYPFEVKSVLQIVADYIRQGRIRLDPSRNSKKVTLHDPCNLVRLGGIVEEQRYILRHAVTDFVEMTPNREKNYCCGGGGGQLAMTNFAERRLEAGRIKADQVRATSAQVVVTPCHNCIDQFMELNKHYQLGIEIKTVCEMVAEALVLS